MGGGGGDGGGDGGLGGGGVVVTAWVGWPWLALLMVVWVVVVVVVMVVGLLACCGWLCMSLANVLPFGTAVYASASTYVAHIPSIACSTMFLHRPGHVRM